MTIWQQSDKKDMIIDNSTLREVEGIYFNGNKTIIKVGG